VKICGKYVPVPAELLALEELSVHADADDVLAWLRRAPANPRCASSTTASPRPPRLFPGGSATNWTGAPSCRGAGSG